MIRSNHLGLAAALCVVAQAAAAFPNAPAATEAGLLCRYAIQQAEAGSGMPQHLLGAIARVESGRPDPLTGRLHPWPWTINAEGKGYFFDSKAEAVQFARGLQARGVQSFDTGCLQVNVMYHPDAFRSLEDAFDPLTNARYAVKFLTELRDKSGSWDTASAWYHSANPDLGGPYRVKVVAAIASEANGAAAYAGMARPASEPAMPLMSSLRSLPLGPGNVVMRAGPAMGAILPLPGASYAAMGAGPAAAPAQASAQVSAMPAGFGKGLDAYRMQPVAMVGPRLVASR